MCNCGCNVCGLKKVLTLNESLAPKQILSEGLKYHMDNNRPLTEHVYRAGSESYFNLWAEARSMYSRGILEIANDDDLAVLTETDLGHFGMFDGKRVPLDFPIELSEETVDWPKVVNSRYSEYKFELEKIMPDRAKYKVIDVETGKEEPGGRVYGTPSQLQAAADDLIKPSGGRQSSQFEESLEERINNILEAKKKKKKLNKPMRDSKGGKAYKVYVKDPKTGNIKTVRFGSGGLKAKINDKKARQAFAKRHKCGTGEKKTSARYWSCRLPRYAKLLGLSSNFTGFW